MTMNQWTYSPLIMTKPVTPRVTEIFCGLRLQSRYITVHGCLSHNRINGNAELLIWKLEEKWERRKIDEVDGSNSDKGYFVFIWLKFGCGYTCKLFIVAASMWGKAYIRILWCTCDKLELQFSDIVLIYLIQIAVLFPFFWSIWISLCIVFER